VWGGSLSAFKSRVSTPRSSSVGKTVTVADAFAKHVVEVATKLNLKGSASSARAVIENANTARVINIGSFRTSLNIFRLLLYETFTTELRKSQAL
jgi:flagellar hook assembly protein FlgD